jgi:chitinase
VFAALAITASVATASLDRPQPPFDLFAGTSRRLIADYGYWSKYQKPSYSADQVPYRRLTQIIHVGLSLDEKADGSLDVPGGFLEPSLVSRAHAAGVQVMILIGGGAKVFAAVASSASARRTFASDLLAFEQAHDYDGVDIDWEYPQGPKQGADFAALMRALRSAFPSPRYLISSDIVAIPYQVDADYNFADSMNDVDFFNDMTYDMAGPWTSSAQLNSPILPDPHDPWPDGSVKHSLDLLEGEYGVPAAMLNVGNPFYGYHYTTVDALYDRCRCDGQAFSENYGTYIKQRVDALGWRRLMDWSSGTPYLLYEDGRQAGFITYDDARSTYERTSYALWTREAGGSFMWSLDADYDGRSQDLFDAMWSAFERRQ